MARTPVKFLLVALICIEVILWSRSRQGIVSIEPTSSARLGYWKSALAADDYSDEEVCTLVLISPNTPLIARSVRHGPYRLTSNASMSSMRVPNQKRCCE
jgi:hypothetical protein